MDEQNNQAQPEAETVATGEAQAPGEVSSNPDVEKNPHQKFVDGYGALMEQTGMMISVEPKFVKRDDNTYSIVVESQVVPKA